VYKKEERIKNTKKEQNTTTEKQKNSIQKWFLKTMFHQRTQIIDCFQRTALVLFLQYKDDLSEE